MSDYYDESAYAEPPQETGYDANYDAGYEANYDASYDSSYHAGYDGAADSEQRFYAQTEFMNDPVGAVGHVGDALYEAGEFYYHGAQTVYAVATGDDEARDRHMEEQQQDIDQASDALLNAADDLGLPLYNTEPRPDAEPEY